MILTSCKKWDESAWELVKPIYYDAFPKHGRKSDAIIRRILECGIGVLHAGSVDDEVVAMALTGEIREINALLIDYFAVREDMRGQGLGSAFLASLTDWAHSSLKLSAAIVEVEAEDDGIRVAFWERNGFILTDYVHRYVWVPEPYRAMYRTFNETTRMSSDGAQLFQYITKFHGKAYRNQ